MTKVAILYDSSKEQSIISRQIARLYHKNNTIVEIDLVGKDNAALNTVVDTTLYGTGATYHQIEVCAPHQATYSAAGMLTHDQLAKLDYSLVTANKGTAVISGTCGSNATVTEIVLTGDDCSADDDAYNGMYIKTAGTTAVFRYITDYVGSTKTVTVATTTTAITTTETFVIYEYDYVNLIGDASSNITATRVAWDTLFPNARPGKLIQIMGGYGTLHGHAFTNYPVPSVTADSVGAATFVENSTFDCVDEDYTGAYLGIISSSSSTTAVGQIRQINSIVAASGTCAVDTWNVTPSGTVTAQVSFEEADCLANLYLPYAILTYLNDDTVAVNKEWVAMLDKYGKSDIVNKPIIYGDESKLYEYIAIGKHIYDAKAAAIVT